MSTTTTNYGLVKPSLTDSADITAMNQNWDKIDEKLYKAYSPENKPNANDVGALPLSGGVMTGQGFYINNKTTRIVGNQNGVWLRTASSDVDNNKDARHLKLWNGTYQDDITKSLLLFDATTGEDYVIYGEHNKPSGQYSGNGSTASRTIEIGGLGNALLINGQGYSTLVMTYGAMYIKNDGTTIAALPFSKIHFVDGVLTIATSESVVNHNGGIYKYQVL